MLRLFLPLPSALLFLMLAACQPNAGIDTEAVASPAQVELTDHAVQRCPRCGWIESKREGAWESA
jgi:hypothetical protein